MCGFSLAITKNKLDDLSFLDNIKHRGPDDRQFISMCFNNFYINLVFYRLSIIDLENGKQPFLYETSNEKFTITGILLRVTVMTSKPVLIVKFYPTCMKPIRHVLI